MKEWDESTNSSLGLSPDALSPYTHKKASWKCSKCGHVWIAEINSRSRGTGCPNCKGEKISKAKEIVKPGNSLAERFPEIAKEWHPYRNGNIAPDTINSGSKRFVWWQCERGTNGRLQSATAPVQKIIRHAQNAQRNCIHHSPNRQFCSIFRITFLAKTGLSLTRKK